MNLRLSIVLAAASAALSGSAVAVASGGLDTTFNAPFGYDLQPFNLGGNDADYITAALPQADGKIVMAGYAISGANASKIALKRLLANGNYDPGFNGGTGYAAVAIASGSYTSDFPYVYAAALDAQGRILVAGATATDFCSYVARFTANGALDTAFGSGGFYVDCPAAGHGVTYWDLAVDAANRPVVVGRWSDTSGDFTVRSSVIVRRLTAAGQPDATFNGGSAYLRSIGDVADSHDAGGAVAFDASGRIYVGATAQGSSQDSVIVLRLSANGTADASCGSNGAVHVGAEAGSDFFPSAIVLRDAHHVFVAGTATDRATSNNAILYAEMDADTCAAGSVGAMWPASNQLRAARAAAASDGAVYLSYAQLESSQAGSPWYSGIVALYDPLPYSSTLFGIVTDESAYGEGIAVSGGRPLQALRQQRSGTDYDYAVVRFDNDRIFYSGFDRDGLKATFF